MKRTYEKPIFIKTMYISTDTMADYGDAIIFNGGFTYAKAEGYESCNCGECPSGTTLCVEIISCEC